MSGAPPEQEDDPTALFGAAAHEIKNALGPLAMTLQLAERQLLAGGPIAPADLAFARAQVGRIASLVADLMDLSRADLGQLSVEPRPGDLRLLVTEVIDVFHRGNAARVAAHLPSGPVTAAFDAARIQQVVLNLLENAARYAPGGTPIDVDLAPAGAKCLLAVRDRGPGVAPEERRRIFDRFVRGAAARDKGGLGIGLYLCRIIVERHAGAIGVDAAPGGGARFWIELPAA